LYNINNDKIEKSLIDKIDNFIHKLYENKLKEENENLNKQNEEKLTEDQKNLNFLLNNVNFKNKSISINDFDEKIFLEKDFEKKIGQIDKMISNIYYNNEVKYFLIYNRNMTIYLIT
jgi:hypothetical protein